MIIGIDGNEANIENRVGVNMYAYEILWNLYKLQDEWKNTYRFRIYLKANPLPDMPKEVPGFWEYVLLLGGRLWIVSRLMPRLYEDRARVKLFFTPSHYLPPFAPMPRVCSIMDLGYLENSGQFRQRDYWQLRLWSAWSIYVAKKVIAISNSTKKDIVRHYKFTRGKVVVTPLAYDKKRFNTNISSSDVRRSKKKYKIEKNYILFLSTLKPSKNLMRLMASWKKIEADFPEYNLVIAGKKGWLYKEIFELVDRLGLSGRVLFIGYVDEKHKAGLIAGARVFVLPSLWEGFGLDVLSAMGSGVPVIVSNRGSLPEVSGEAGIVVNPLSTISISRGIRKVLSLSKRDYDILAREGVAQAEKFSWEKTARDTLGVFNMVLEQNDER